MMSDSFRSVPVQRQQGIIQALERTRVTMSSNNEQQASNLKVLALNLKVLLDYALKGIQQLIESLENQQKIQKKLVGFIFKQGLGQRIPAQIIETPKSFALDKLNSKINELIHQNSQQPGLKGVDKLLTLDGRMGERRGLGGTADRYTKAIRQKNSLEFKLAIKYVNQHLAQTMDALDSEALIPKSVILNLFVHWNQQRGYQLNRSNLNVLQMALTNELKRKFPSATHNSTVFKGLRFKPEYKHLMKLADNGQIPEVPHQADDNSQQIPQFQDDSLA